MHLSKSPLSLRSAAIVGVSVLALALVLGSFRVRAVGPEAVPDKEEAAKPQVVAEETKKITPEVFRIEPFHVLKIRAVKTLPDEPISGNYLVEPEGKVDLGPSYGKVSVKGLTLEEAADAVTDHLRTIGRDPRVSVTLAGWTTKWKDDAEKKGPFRIKPFHLLNIRAIGTPPDQPISAPHLVEPSGKVDLGPGYGKVDVKGLTLEEAAAEVLQHLRRFLKDPKVSVTLAGWENDWRDLEKDGTGPPTKAPAKSESKKEALRYDKKSFDEWRSNLLTELKPEARIEAIKALRTFGVNGYSEEATRAILAVIKGYGNSVTETDDQKVLMACSEALIKIGSPAINVLLQDLKQGKKEDRLAALRALALPDLNSSFDVKLIPPAIAAIMAAMKDPDPDIRANAVGFFAWHIPDDETAVTAIIEALKDKDPRVTHNAIEVVGWDYRDDIFLREIKKMGPNVKALVPGLINALKEPPPRTRPDAISIDLNRQGALKIIRIIGPQAKEAIPALAELLKEKDDHSHLDVIKTLRKIDADPKLLLPALIEIVKNNDIAFSKEAIEILGQIGPEAKTAVPALLEQLAKVTNAQDAVVILDALGNIGPGAKDAVPELTKLTSQYTSEEAKKAAAKALEKIAK